MRGFPPIQIFLLCLAFIALAVPLSHLTGTSMQAKPVPRAAEKAETSSGARLRLRYAHRPATLSVKIADKELVRDITASPLEIKITLRPQTRAWTSSWPPPGRKARRTPP